MGRWTRGGGEKRRQSRASQLSNDSLPGEHVTRPPISDSRYSVPHVAKLEEGYPEVTARREDAEVAYLRFGMSLALSVLGRCRGEGQDQSSN